MFELVQLSAKIKFILGKKIELRCAKLELGKKYTGNKFDAVSVFFYFLVEMSAAVF